MSRFGARGRLSIRSCAFRRTAPILVCLLLACQAGRASPLDFERSGLAWSSEEVARATHQPLDDVLRKSGAAAAPACSPACAGMKAIWARLVAVLPPSAMPAGLRLHVVPLAEVEAFSVPSGDVVIGEPYVEDQRLGDEEIAFVLAHEMAHVVLQHERQWLTAARAVLPPVRRTVRDMYVELDFNMGLQRLLEPVHQAAELEADDFGLQLASLAGYAPHLQLMFLVDSADLADAPQIVRTHPPTRERIARALQRWPLALRMWRPAAAPAAEPVAALCAPPSPSVPADVPRPHPRVAVSC